MDDATDLFQMPPGLDYEIPAVTVPISYAVCLLVFLLDAVEFNLRVRQAEAVAPVLRNAPDTLSELVAELGERAGEIRAFRRGGPGDFVDMAKITLRPRHWLEVECTLAQDGEQLTDVVLLYALSEELDLDDPAASLPSG